MIYAAEGQDAQTGGTESLITSVSYTIGKDGEDLFGKETPTKWEDGTLKIHLSYNESNKYAFNKGNKLTISLPQVAGNNQFVFIESDFRKIDALEDKNAKELVAGMKLDDNLKTLTFTFNNKDNKLNNFEADIEIPYYIQIDDVADYFNEEANKNKTSTDFKCQLEVNGQMQAGKILNFSVDKPKVEHKETSVVEFGKTSGTYTPSDGNNGYLLYNIDYKTALAHANRYVIYDTPETKMEFNGYIKVDSVNSAADRKSQQKERLFFSDGKTIKRANDKTAKTEVNKVYVYEVYYKADKDGKYPEYVERKYNFKNPVKGYENVSIENGFLPKEDDILFEIQLGTKPSEKQKEDIEKLKSQGAKVGKGFKVEIYNLDSKYYTNGGRIYITCKFDITDVEHLEKDKDGDPVASNIATYYGEEIPTCTETDKYCTPLKAEKANFKSDYYGSKNKPAAGKVKSGKADATVSNPSFGFTKVDENIKPLEGAVISIFNSPDGKTKGEIAKNDKDILLENLKTNSKGKLVDEDGNIISLSFNNKGYYIIEEITAPENYIKAEKPLVVKLDNGKKDYELKNKKKETSDSKPGGGTHIAPTPNQDKVQEKPKDQEKPVVAPAEQPAKQEKTQEPTTKQVKTGDNNLLASYAALILSSAGLIYLISRRRKHN